MVHVSDFDYFCRIEKILLKSVAFVIYIDYYDNTNLLTPCFNSLEISKLKDAICILFSLLIYFKQNTNLKSIFKLLNLLQFENLY